MDKPRLLSGDELVARGITKIDASLPEIGLKDVTPNGSWLEQKQIQSALEARKHLIEAERIAKCGTLSEAEWRDELMLAEVTRKAGGHWQFMGHNLGPQLYLQPEEALFLIEVNCLQLKYNEVTVSLQQAYALLLRTKISLDQYKAYASLSRLGYKVFRHEATKSTEYETKINLTSISKKEDQIEVVVTSNENNNPSEYCENKDDVKPDECVNHVSLASSKVDINVIGNRDGESTNIEDTGSKNHSNSNENEVSAEKKCDQSEEMVINPMMEVDSDIVVEKDSGTNNNINSDEKITIRAESDLHEESDNNFDTNNMDCSYDMSSLAEQGPTTTSTKTTTEPRVRNLSKLQILEERQLKSCSQIETLKHFVDIPDLFQKQQVTVKIPEEKYIPKNVFLNETSYKLNIENISTKKVRSPTRADSRTYNVAEEVNGAHVRRVRDSFIDTIRSPQTFFPQFTNTRFMGPNLMFRPFNFWRPRLNMNYFPFNPFFQRNFLPSLNFPSRFCMFPRQPFPPGEEPNLPSFDLNNENNGNETTPNITRKRTRDNAKKKHLEAIKNLAVRLKQLARTGNRQEQNVRSLQRLLQTYNTRYKTGLRLTEQFEVINDEVIVETIQLDDEEESSRSKKPRTETDNVNRDENLNRLKQLAMRLKELESKNNSNARNRRAFSNLIKRFNKSYNSDIYVSRNYEILDRRHITLDSSSESDCIVETTPKTLKGKKLKNPFSILKRLSEKQTKSHAGTSKERPDEVMNVPDGKYSEVTTKTFNKNWLPDENDFGRAEVFPRNLMYLLDTRKEEFLFDFIKNEACEFKNWLDIKILFLRNIQKTNTLFQNTVAAESNGGLDSIIGPGDCTDIPYVLKKLSIIQNNKQVRETNLNVDFDVYKRDVQNFRKTSRPKPHFRVICVNESARFPSGEEVASLHSKYTDKVEILFAIVGVSSVSYLQVNPSELPVYIPCNDVTYYT